MPRIRYRRDYDFTLYPTEDEDSDQEQTATEYIERSGNSWLSNSVIASQLPERKIKDAIRSLKAQIAALETELLSRRLTGNSETRRLEFTLYGDPIDKPRKRRTAESKRKTGHSKKFNSLRTTLKKLGVQDIDSLLNEWSKIA